jgi:hypothetical protein
MPIKSAIRRIILVQLLRKYIPRILVYYNYTINYIIIIIIIIIRDFSFFDVRPSNKHCPSARCAYAANAVGKDLDIFAIGAFSLNHIYSY